MRKFLDILENTNLSSVSTASPYSLLKSLAEDANGMSERPVINTPEFKKWFSNSKAIDANGKPLILYTGTSKDVDFKHFRVPKSGVWFTKSAKDASAYAQDNDSQGGKFDYHTNRYIAQHTASRVIPVFLKIVNPKYYETLPSDLQTAQNYRKAQGILFDKLRSEGYDSVIIGDETYVLLDYNDPSKVKSALGNTEFTNKKNIHETVSTDSYAFRQWFRNSKVVDSNGNPLPVYHGTGRPDRVGKQFRKSRATAGPMAYFTDNPTVASGYAQTKPDTSYNGEDSYGGWFKVKIPGSRSLVNIQQAWYYLSSEEKQKIASLAPRIGEDDDDEIHLFGPEKKNGLGPYDYTIKEHRGNHLAALVDNWLNGGTLFNREEEFLKVLKLAGMTTPVEFFDPNATYPFVYQVFLSIQNPLVSTNIPKAVLVALEKASRRQSYKNDGGYQWDKKTTDARNWMNSLLDDLERTGGSQSWTVVPDFATKVLKNMGYDGIHDIGGKKYETSHSVWIPFEENQVKSAISNKNFDPGKKNIHEGAPTVADVPEEPNPSLARCTTVSCNAILDAFKKPRIKSAAEMPRTGMDSLKLLTKRGLKYIPDIFFKPTTVANFVRNHPNGTYYLGCQNHALALVGGELWDTERKGLDGRMVLVVAEIVQP